MKRCTKCGIEKPVAAFGVRRASKDGLAYICKACKSEYCARHYQEHRRERLDKQAEFYRQHPERLHEIVVASHKRYYQTHKQEYKDYGVQWWKRHPGKAYEYTKVWAKRHPQQARRIRNNAHRQRKMRFAGVCVERVDAFAIAERDRWICHLCGKRVPRNTMTLDHLIPISKGGPHTDWNVALAHRSCNSRRGAGRTPAQLRLPL